MTTRDTIAIGTSAGGVEALPKVLGPLPGDLPAAILVVQHLSPVHQPYLVEILRRAVTIPVGWAEQGARVDPGRIYVAPPNSHMLLEGDHLRLDNGPRENHVRPSIDRLFRSAAANRGSRTIGVLLTGMLDDGVAGLRDIQRAGGVAIVQDPHGAQFPELPSRALIAIQPDHVLDLVGIPGALHRLTTTFADDTKPPERVLLEAALDRKGPTDAETMDVLGKRVELMCPDCGGPMWDVGESHRRYRCYLGHAASANDLLERGGERLETALWEAVRALRERAATYGAMADDAFRRDHTLTHEAYRRRAREALAHSELARKFLLDLISEP